MVSRSTLSPIMCAHPHPLDNDNDVPSAPRHQSCPHPHPDDNAPSPSPSPSTTTMMCSHHHPCPCPLPDSNATLALILSTTITTCLCHHPHPLPLDNDDEDDVAHLRPNCVHSSTTARLPLPPDPFKPGHLPPTLLRNSCRYMTYPTFSSPPTDHPISPSTNSSLRRTDTGTYPHSPSTPRSARRNSVPILDASSCFTFLVLIRFALPPVLRSAGLHLVPRMFSSFDSAAALHSLCSTGSPFRFPFLHRTILHLVFSLVQ